MKTLDLSFAYTKEMMSDKIKTMYESYYKSALKDLEGYLLGTEHVSSVSLSLEYLSNWYLWRFLYEYTTNKKNDFNILAKSTYYGLFANKWKYKLGLKFAPYNKIISFSNSSAQLALLLFLGHNKQAKSYLSLILTMLDGKQSKNFASYPAYPWFILDLYLRAEGKNVSDNWNYPNHMGIYGKVLDYWDSENKFLVDELINKLCISHIKQSDEYIQYQQPEDAGDFDPDAVGWELLEFSSANYFILPVEILAWLSLRRQKGLYCGNDLPPLLQYSINIPPENISVPEIEPLIIQCIDKFNKDYPDLKFKVR